MGNQVWALALQLHSNYFCFYLLNTLREEGFSCILCCMFQEFVLGCQTFHFPALCTWVQLYLIAFLHHCYCIDQLFTCTHEGWQWEMAIGIIAIVMSPRVYATPRTNKEALICRSSLVSTQASDEYLVRYLWLQGKSSLQRCCADTSLTLVWEQTTKWDMVSIWHFLVLARDCGYKLYGGLQELLLCI